MTARNKTILLNLLVAMLTAAATSLSGVQIPGLGSTPAEGQDCPVVAPCQCAPCPAAPDCDGAFQPGPDAAQGRVG